LTFPGARCGAKLTELHRKTYTIAMQNQKYCVVKPLLFMRQTAISSKALWLFKEVLVGRTKTVKNPLILLSMSSELICLLFVLRQRQASFPFL
jgi:hypothetical protein